MQTFPNIVQRFVDKAGIILQPFIGYLTQFTIPPPPFLTLDVDGSPFEYVVQEPGNVALIGGNITNFSITRGGDTLSFGAVSNRTFPVAINDTITVTYLAEPAVTFIPSYGQNTTS